jgi:DNA-binding response OmpR family regulator
MSAASKTVLLVDDAPEILRLHRAIVERAGYRVVATQSSVDALARLATEAPDVVVLDYDMPELDAPAFLRRMRADPRFDSVGVLVVTASDEATHVSEVFAAGGDEYLVKPIQRAIFLARIDAVSRARRPARTGT